MATLDAPRRLDAALLDPLRPSRGGARGKGVQSSVARREGTLRSSSGGRAGSPRSIQIPLNRFPRACNRTARGTSSGHSLGSHSVGRSVAHRNGGLLVDIRRGTGAGRVPVGRFSRVDRLSRRSFLERPRLGRRCGRGRRGGRPRRPRRAPRPPGRGGGRHGYHWRSSRGGDGPNGEKTKGESDVPERRAGWGAEAAESRGDASAPTVAADPRPAPPPPPLPPAPPH